MTVANRATRRPPLRLELERLSLLGLDRSGPSASCCQALGPLSGDHAKQLARTKGGRAAIMLRRLSAFDCLHFSSTLSPELRRGSCPSGHPKTRRPVVHASARAYLSRLRLAQHAFVG